LASGSSATTKGFRSDKPFRANVAMASALEGDVEASRLDLDVAGGGRVTLKGRAKEVKVSAAQASWLFLAEFAADSADVTLRTGAGGPDCGGRRPGAGLRAARPRRPDREIERIAEEPPADAAGGGGPVLLVLDLPELPARRAAPGEVGEGLPGPGAGPGDRRQ